MLSTPHVALGMSLILIIPDKILALTLALLSHFVFDFALPHWNPPLFRDYKKTKKLSFPSLLVIFFDSLLALWLIANVIYFTSSTSRQMLYIILAAFLSILPDLVKIPVYFFKLKNELLLTYIKYEHKYQARAKAGIGILTQLVVLVACLYFISQSV